MLWSVDRPIVHWVLVQEKIIGDISKKWFTKKSLNINAYISTVEFVDCNVAAESTFSVHFKAPRGWSWVSSGHSPGHRCFEVLLCLTLAIQWWEKAFNFTRHIVVWILASDICQVFVKLNQNVQILKWQCCPYQSKFCYKHFKFFCYSGKRHIWNIHASWYLDKKQEL